MMDREKELQAEIKDLKKLSSSTFKRGDLNEC